MRIKLTSPQGLYYLVMDSFLLGLGMIKGLYDHS